MKPLTPGAYQHLKAAAYRYVSILDFTRVGNHTKLTVKPFTDMNEADTRHSIMGIDDSLISGAVNGDNQNFSIEYILS